MTADPARAGAADGTSLATVGRSDTTQKAALLARFVGPLEERDQEMIEYWRQATPAEHARAMIELAAFVENVAAHTQLTKEATIMFPGFPRARCDRLPVAGS